MPDPKSRLEGRSKLKIGRREARDTGDRDPYRGQKVKVSRPINVETQNAPKCREGLRDANLVHCWSTFAVCSIKLLTYLRWSEDKVITSRRHFEAHDSTKKRRGSAKIGRKVDRATG